MTELWTVQRSIDFRTAPAFLMRRHCVNSSKTQSHWKCGDVPCCRDLFLCARKGAQQCRHGLEHPFVMSCGIVGLRMAATTATANQALTGSRSTICVPPRVSSVKAWMNASDPIGDPNTCTPSRLQTSSPKSSMSWGRIPCSKCGSSPRAAGSLRLSPTWCP